MATEDFDIDSLAAYLHLAPRQVMRLADRGKIPARKVGGAWRFTQAEVHHWLEDRIGVSDDVGLVEMEGVLGRTVPADEPDQIILADMLPQEAISIPLAAKTRDSVIRKIIATGVETGLLWDPDRMAEAVRNREQLCPTALEGGVALMHPRRPLPSVLGEAFLALGITPGGIPFGGGSSGLTDVFFLICSVSDSGHLRTLARLSRVIGRPGFLPALRDAPDAAAAHDLIAQTETELSG